MTASPEVREARPTRVFVIDDSPEDRAEARRRGHAGKTRRRGDPVEMHQIRYFLTVCETLNLTKAAERCNVAQPSLTRAIKALERVEGLSAGIVVVSSQWPEAYRWKSSPGFTVVSRAERSTPQLP